MINAMIQLAIPDTQDHQKYQISESSAEYNPTKVSQKRMEGRHAAPVILTKTAASTFQLQK